jgi:hypothetical protein
MPVFSKRTPIPQPACAIDNYQSDYRRADLVNMMLSQAARSLPPAEWPDAAKAALAVADELYPEDGGTGDERRGGSNG